VTREHAEIEREGMLSDMETLWAEKCELRAEIERLKAALNEIWIDAGFQDTAGAYRICGIAKAALEPKP
jgi:hypothetical protein